MRAPGACVLVAATFLLTACPEPPPPVFVEIASQVGLDFVHSNGMSGDLLFLETMGSGLGMLDFDGDGDLDLYLVQGHMLGEGQAVGNAGTAPGEERSLQDRLFRNELAETGTLRFTDRTTESGIRSGGYGMGVAVADYDNDGCPDIYVLNWGPNQLWRNRCDGTFEEVAEAAGVSDARWSTGATFFDSDRDGWLDLYVVNYKEYDPERDPRCRDRRGRREYCGPTFFRSQADGLYRNRGDGTFEDVSTESLAGAREGAGLGVVATDLDGNGRVDLYVTNDREPNFLWDNRGGHLFEEVATANGVAIDGRGMPLASMGVDAADVDDDGDVDLVMSHLDGEPNVLYRNLGEGLFEDVSTSSGLGRPSWSSTGFGLRLFDYDGDGRLDLFVANGAVETLPELRRAGDPYPLHQPNQLFRSSGPGRFSEVPGAGDRHGGRSEVSRGAAFGDLDNDGDTDIVISNNAGPVRALENRLGNTGRWLGLVLVTGEAGRIAHGARVRIDRRGMPSLLREVRNDGSYASAHDPRLLVGLGTASAVDAIQVRWPDGATERFEAPHLDRYIVLQQGTGTFRVGGGSRRPQRHVSRALPLGRGELTPP